MACDLGECERDSSGVSRICVLFSKVVNCCFLLGHCYLPPVFYSLRSHTHSSLTSLRPPHQQPLQPQPSPPPSQLLHHNHHHQRNLRTTATTIATRSASPRTPPQPEIPDSTTTTSGTLLARSMGPRKKVKEVEESSTHVMVLFYIWEILTSTIQLSTFLNGRLFFIIFPIIPLYL